MSDGGGVVKKKVNVWTIVLCVSLVLLLLLALVSDAMSVGDKLASVNVYLAVAFYVLIGVVVCVGIVYPLVGVFFAPVFSLDKLHGADGSVHMKWCRKLVKNLISNVDLTDEEKVQITGYLGQGDSADDLLIEFYDRKITPVLNREIYETAKKVLIVTAVSQNSTVDMIGMASANFTLIKRIVEICGFRPNNVQVFRLYLRVLSMTMLAGALEDINMEDLVSKATESTFGKALGLVSASAVQGTVNALTTLRIGVITKNYLLNADVSMTRKELRKKSYTEAFGILQNILKQNFGEKVDKVKDPVKRFFGRKKNEVEVLPGE